MSIKKIPGNVYAILRIDDFSGASVAIEDRVAVVRVVPDLAAAKSEVVRLNNLNGAKACRYFWQATRLGDWVPEESDND